LFETGSDDVLEEGFSRKHVSNRAGIVKLCPGLSDLLDIGDFEESPLHSSDHRVDAVTDAIINLDDGPVDHIVAEPVLDRLDALGDVLNEVDLFVFN
jgi:hypothetical protein